MSVSLTEPPRVRGGEASVCENPGQSETSAISSTNVWYALSSQADERYRRTIHELASLPNVNRICEIGGGANPALDVDFVREQGIDYTVVDVSAAELEKAPAEYNKVLTDISQTTHDLDGSFDLIFSMWCCEHVREAATFHQNIFKLLAPGGRSMHLFPTLYSPPFVLNWMMPEWLSERLLLLLQPHREPEGDHGKFPAYYSWCRGPSKGQLRRFESLGYQVDEYAGFFGHSGNVAFGSGYLNRIPPLRLLHEWISRAMVRYPSPWLSTLSYMVLSRPQTD